MSDDLVLSDGTKYHNIKPSGDKTYERVRVVKAGAGTVMMWREKAAKK